eukprot:s2028_g3.t1
MGFRLLGDDEVPLAAIAVEREDFVANDPAPIAPEDEIVGIEMEDERQQDVEGQAIPHGQLVLAPERGDHMIVNGVELFPHTALATLREACGFYGISRSGSKERCFKRLWEFQKRLELQTALTAARETEAAQKREPIAQTKACRAAR